MQDFPTGYNVYNVGYGMSYSLNQIADSLAKLLERKIKIEYPKSSNPDITDMSADIRNVSKAFNSEPTVDIKNGLKLIVQSLSN